MRPQPPPFINIWSEPGHCPQIPLVAPAWDRIRSENETYIFRLKRPDEELRPIRAPGYR